MLFCFVIGFGLTVRAQQPDTTPVNRKDSLNRVRDSVKSKRYYPKITKEKTYNPDSLHDPHKAVMRSLMIPGWGQLYNHQWYKVPFIYAGIGLLVDVVIFNQKNYNVILKEAQLREKGLPGDPAYVGIATPDIDNALNAYRRNRDLGILGTLGAWGIQMVDAYIAAKFQHSYTMDNNLSFNVRPGVLDQSTYAFNSYTLIPAVKLTLTLK